MLETMRIFPRLRGGQLPFVVEAHRGGGSTFAIVRTEVVASTNAEDAAEAGRELFRGRVAGRYRVSARRASCYDLGMEPVDVAPTVSPDLAR